VILFYLINDFHLKWRPISPFFCFARPLSLSPEEPDNQAIFPLSPEEPDNQAIFPLSPEEPDNQALFHPDHLLGLSSCSAGVGRTGTYIALDYLLAQATAEGSVDMFQSVVKMRARRPKMVQTRVGIYNP